MRSSDLFMKKHRSGNYRRHSRHLYSRIPVTYFPADANLGDRPAQSR